MNKKRTLAMLLAGAMLLPANAFAASPEDFTDFPTDWSAAGLRSAVQNGLLNGSNGQINSSGLLIRAQMAAIVNRAFAARKTADLSVYSDANTSAWYYNDLKLAVAMRTFQGANGKLNPEAPITREEAFVVLARAFALESGDTSVLNNYTDGASVSAWARSSVAALIENGYVNGANGKLNPKNSITRAEFAKVISEMASTYADADDSLSATVDGSVIVRENGVSLSGKTINGDLIIADGISRIDLTGVTVTGRIVLRGGESGVTFKDTKAGKGIIANTDIAVSGSVDSITVVADGAKITGSGKVGAVQANADNVTVSTSGTKVTAANGVSGVKAGNKSVAAGKTETVGAAASGGGSSSSGSSSSGGGSSSGGSSSGGSVAQQSLVVPEQTKLIDMNTVQLGALGQFVVIRFEDGNTLDNCTLTVDGTEINAGCSKVSTDGSIVKWQSTVLDPSTLTVTNKTTGKTQTVSLGGKNTVKPTVSGVPVDYYFLANGPVYVWDYHQTNKDAAGKVRYNPTHTTIDLKTASNSVRFYSPDAVLSESDDNLYHVSGEVQLMFNYANGTDAEKAFVDGITSVVLVQDDESNSVLNSNLKWSLNKALPHGVDGATVACITVPLGQSNFFSNGRYKLRVVSNGNAELFPIHVVNEKTPSLVLSDTGAYSGVNTHFTVKDMLYGITQPIYRVELQYAGDSEVQVLNKFDDWYLIGDTFVLYNDTTNHLTHSGKYTLTIYANGFKSFSQTFYAYGADKQSVSPAARAAAAGVDALSAATSGGGGASSDSGSEGGSNTMNANLVFSADLLTNAKIVEKLGLDNANAAAISERWDNMLHDAVYYEGADKVYTSAGFFDAANTARTEDKLLTFAEYVTSENAETTRNRPYAVKKVLEDNLLGETTSFSEASSSAAPDLTLVKEVTEDGQTSYQSINEVNEGEDAVLLVSGSKAAAYLEKLKENADSQLYLNTTSALSKDAYSIDTEKNTITIPANQLKLGDNALTLQVDTFQKVRLTLTVAKQLEKNLSLSVAETTESGKPVVVFTVDGSNGDFLKNLASVKLDDKTDIGTYGYYGYGSEMAYYVIGKDNKTISLYNVPSGEHTVAISAKYYGEPLTAKFTVNAKPAEAAKSAPTVSGAKKKTDTSYTGTYSYYRLSFTGLNASDLTTYLAKVNQVKVNDTVLTRGYSSSSLADNNFRPAATNTTYSTSAYDVLDLPVSLFANAGDYKIKLTADGYTDVEYTLTVGDSSSSGDSSNSGSSGSTVTAPTKLPTISKGSNMYCTLTFSGAATWLAQDGLTVTVNDSVYQKTDSIYNLDGGGAYYVEDDRISLKIPYRMFTSTTSKLVISDGTTNINLTVTIPDYSSGKPTVSFTE
ncbi:S-layer homology domain-containing protein [Butyricicoccus sp.]|uniref:S-layer homology domain-containing protein n=1 Tax=Butyricicoccus sp. TaxID=2049021 RepID=UPI00307F8674